MIHTILLFVEWPAFAGHFVLYGFAAVILALAAVVGVDMRRAARVSGGHNKKDTRFLSPYRDEHGMPIYFEAGEDPSARSARRVFNETRRARIGERNDR